MPAQRGVATYDRNRVAVELAGLAFGRATGTQRKERGVLPANREDRQSECHWVVPGARRKADRELDYTAPISEVSDGSLMEV
jgi:hypothetical protein